MESQKTTQPLPTNPPPLPSPKPRLPLLLGGLFLSLLILVGSYFVFGTKKPATTPFSQPPPTAVQTVNSTANWKTYRNTAYGYELQYPGDWELWEAKPDTDSSSQNGDLLDEGELQKVTFVEKNPEKSQGRFQISVLANPSNSTLEQWAKNYKMPNPASPENNLARVGGETTLGGEPAKMIGIFTFIVPGEQAVVSVKNNNVYYIRFPDWEKYNDTEIVREYGAEKHIQIYKKILSSFTFLDQYQIDATGWQTYTDSQNIFSFKYPADVVINPQQENKNQLNLYVEVKDLKNYEDQPLGYSLETALSDKKSLENNQFGDSFSSIPNSRKLTTIDNIKGKTFIILIQLDACDIRFNKTLIIFKGDYQIIITLTIPYAYDFAQKIPGYFLTNQELCSGGMMWNSEEKFVSDLESGITQKDAQEWYNLFDQILSTFKFLE